MKRILSLLIIFVMLIGAFSVTVSAEDNTLTAEEKELADLFDLAFKRYMTILGWYTGNMAVDGYSDFMEYVVVSGPPCFVIDDVWYYQFTFENLPGNDAYPLIQLETLADAEKYFLDCYTEELLDDLMFANQWRNEGDLFVEKDGQLYIGISAILMHWYKYKDLRNIKISGDTATADVSFGFTSQYTGYEEKFHEDRYVRPGMLFAAVSYETVEFTKTSDGWRVSGGTVIDLLLQERQPTPNTGDESFLQIVMLGFIAAAAVIGAWSVCRKRRRA